MIKAYLTAIPTLYEGEDIEVRYSLFQDEVCIKKESIFLEYAKPAIVGQVSVLTLLEKLKQYKEQEIVVILNDASLYEVIKGTSTTKNGEIIKMANKINKRLGKFENVSFVNITKDKNALENWKKILEHNL